VARQDFLDYLGARGLDAIAAQQARLAYWSTHDLKAGGFAPWAAGAVYIPYLEPRHDDPRKARVRGHRLRYMGDVAKGERYRQPKRQASMLYFPPGRLYPKPFSWADYFDAPDVPLFVTEGEVCACKAMAEGYVTVALPGIWSWLDKLGPIRDLDRFTWQGLDVVLVPDGDVVTNADVAEASARFRAEAMRRGSRNVSVVVLPDQKDLDEFLKAQGSAAFDELVNVAAEQSGEAQRVVELLNKEFVYVYSPQPSVIRLADFRARGMINMLHEDRARATAEHLYNSDRVILPRLGKEKRGRPKHPYMVWTHSPLANRAERIVFEPGRESGLTSVGGKKVFNCFRGWPTGALGDVAKFEKLLDLCFGKETKARTWFLDWCSYPLQHPGAKLFSAVVIYGGQGTGKTFLGKILETCHGPSGAAITAEMVANRFNDYLSAKTFIRVEEMHTDGRFLRPIKSRLKTFITENELWVEPKGLQRFPIRNAANFYFSSNEPGAIPIDHDDRRYFVWRWRERGDEKWYLEQFDPWIWKKEGWRAVLDYLLTRPITKSFSPSMRPPMTPDKVQMQERTESPHYTMMRELRDHPERYVNGVDWLSVDDMRQLFARRFGEVAPDARSFRQAYVDVYGAVVEQRVQLGEGYIPRESYLLCIRDHKRWSKRKETYGAVARHYKREWADHKPEERLGHVESLADGAQPVRKLTTLGTGAEA
jgi:hypothetical protein